MGLLLGSGKLATELDRMDLKDEYKLLVHPRIASHGPTLYESGLPSTDEHTPESGLTAVGLWIVNSSA